MPSFDISSEIDQHELTNAVDQSNRELAQRFDFRDSGAKYELEGHTITLHAPVEFQLKQMLDILRIKLGKRGIDVAALDIKEAQANLAAARQQVELRHGIDHETGRTITRLIKDSKLKVQCAIQGDKLRVTGKQRDDLQATMTLLRKSSFDRPLQFGNFRD